MTVMVTPPTTDAEAKDVLTAAYEDVIGPLSPGPDTFALGFAQAVGLQEGKYGAWGPSNSSNNWGAITRSPNADGTCPAGSFTHTDSDSDGVYTTCFRSYATSLDGAKDFLTELFVNRPAVLAAAQAAEYQEAIRQMYATGYFRGTAPHDQKDSNGEYTNVNKYIAFVGRGIDEISPLYPITPNSDNTGLFVALGAAAVVGVLAIASR